MTAAFFLIMNTTESKFMCSEALHSSRILMSIVSIHVLSFTFFYCHEAAQTTKAICDWKIKSSKN